jgi:hypothetical protein
LSLLYLGGISPNKPEKRKSKLKKLKQLHAANKLQLPPKPRAGVKIFRGVLARA